MKRRIFWSVCLASIASLLLFGLLVVGIAYYNNLQKSWNSLATKAYYLSTAYTATGEGFLTEVRGYSGRITLVAPDGTVLFDDKEQAQQMENHATRPEIQQAMQEGTGRAQRSSDTLGEQTLYYAIRLKDGSVLRVSEASATVFGQTTQIIPWLLLVMLVVGAFSAFIAHFQTRAIIGPINKINLDKPFEENAYSELSPLLRRIAEQKNQIKKQMTDLQQKQNEITLITQNMDEGLVVVNQDGMVLSLNQSAKNILNIQMENPIGQHILALNRNMALEQAIRSAVEGKKTNESVEFKEKKYQLTASPSLASNQVKGVVMLLLDVTDKLLAEQQRREFSANVSHELKTPLTSISGYAELIHNGLAKPEDIRDFAGRIQEEATRLITLVEDIIRLSNLDEKAGNLQYSEVNLLSLAHEVADNLTPKAAKKGIAIEIQGQPVTINGVASILNEIIYNLVDNAIRYSDEGPITVHIGQQAQQAAITVADRGVGISPAHQEHIFERFYRVDKSHSRDSGGTGLGLAIVKRGAMFHEGSVTLQSTPGQGSTFTVLLPL